VTLLAEIVDAGDLLNVVWTALVAGIGVCAIYSIAIVGFARGIDMRREGSSVAATLYFAVMAIAVVVVLAVVVFGVITMTSK
jgi:hypothetical protein